MTTDVPIAKDSAAADLTIDLIDHCQEWKLISLEDDASKLAIIAELLGAESDPNLVPSKTRMLLGLVHRHYPATQLKMVKSQPINFDKDTPNAAPATSRLLQLGFAHIPVAIGNNNNTKPVNNKGK